MGKGAQIQSQGVGIEQIARAALGKQVALEFTKSVFGISSLTVEILVQGSTAMGFGRQRSDDETGVVFAIPPLLGFVELARQRLGFADHAPFATPTFQRLIRKLGKHTCGVAADASLVGGRQSLMRGLAFQTRIESQTNNVSIPCVCSQ